jgi:tetratricopeptide (TPR) repeat protein
LSAARRAEGLVRGGTADETLRRRVRRRCADLELVAELEEVRLRRSDVKEGDFATALGDELYGEAFRGAGIDVEELPAEEAAERIRQSTVAAELAAALDDWAMCRRVLRGPGDSSWRSLLGVARAADRDDGRNRVRDALDKRKKEVLLAVATSEEAFRLLPQTLSALGHALLEAGAAAQAEALLREARRRTPDDFWANYDLAWLIMKSPTLRLDEAARLCAAAVALRPQSAVAHNNLGAALFERGEVADAITEYRAALNIDKDYAIAHFNLGNALKQKGDLDGAIAEYRAAIRLNKDYADPHCNLGNALKQKGDLDGAIAEYHEALKINKDYALAHCNLGAALSDKDQLDEAIAEYRKAIRLMKDGAWHGIKSRFKKDFAGAHYNLGNALRDKEDLDGAIDEYRAALDLHKDYAEAHCNLGSVLRVKGRTDEAIDEYREAIRLKENLAEAHLELGNALKQKGDLEGAIVKFRAAIRINERYAMAHYNLGNALKDQGKLDKAIEEYQAALAIDKDYADAECNLGNALLMMGEFDKALFHYRRGHEIGSKKRRWPYKPKSAAWVKDAEHLVDLDRQLPAILSGKEQASQADLLVLADICFTPTKQLYAAAVRFYAEAFRIQPELAGAQPSELRYSAACAAAQAGCGQGKDASHLSDAERARLRRQALDWLRAEGTALSTLLDNQPGKAAPVVAQQMAHWLQDTNFAGVRGPKALGRLPEEERQTWQSSGPRLSNCASRPGARSPDQRSNRFAE